MICAPLLAVGAADAQSRALPLQNPPTPVPANLPDLIRGAVKLKPPQQLEGAEISPLRATSGPQLGDTMLCLKTVADGRTTLIAVFLEAGQVLSYRRAVVYDRCEQEAYAQLAAPRAKAAAARPARRKPLPRPPSAAATAD
jgi:hypothetical protein